MVPLGNASTVNTSKLIHFEELVLDENGERKSDIVFEKLKGLNLRFDLDVTRDAVAQIVLDRATGSVLRGSGDGELSMIIDTNGKFEMYGDLVVANGEYQRPPKIVLCADNNQRHKQSAGQVSLLNVDHFWWHIAVNAPYHL